MKRLTLSLKSGEFQERDQILRRLVGIQYSRNDLGFTRGTFRVRGDVIEIIPVYGENIIRIELFGDEVEKIIEVDPVTGEVLQRLDEMAIFPGHPLYHLRRENENGHGRDRSRIGRALTGIAG